MGDHTPVRTSVRPLKVPPCPDGWRTGPPDFVGVGAQRAGTSWWARVIKAHPEVELRQVPRKELHFFDHFWHGEPPADFVQRYHQLFPRPHGAIAGEWTPEYMHDFWTLPLLAAAAPEARILVLLRDPVERYVSGLSFRIRTAHKQERPLLAEEIGDAVHRGFYFQQMRRLFEYFPREQVSVLQYERCCADPVGQAEVTYRFLGLEPVPPPPRRLKVREPHWKPQISSSARRELVARLRNDVERLLELCPEIDVSLWPNFCSVVGPPPGRPKAHMQGSRGAS